MTWLDVLEYDRYGTGENDYRDCKCERCENIFKIDEMQDGEDFCKECWEELEEENV